MAKRTVKSLTSREPTIMIEGSEVDDFWTLLGGHEEYASSKRLQVGSGIVILPYHWHESPVAFCPFAQRYAVQCVRSPYCTAQCNVCAVRTALCRAKRAQSALQCAVQSVRNPHCTAQCKACTIRTALRSSNRAQFVMHCANQRVRNSYSTAQYMRAQSLMHCAI